MLRYVKLVAFTQADLYGYFFGRGMKRVQIYVTETGGTKTWVEKVDEGNAEETLRKFKEVDAGVKPPALKSGNVELVNSEKNVL